MPDADPSASITAATTAFFASLRALAFGTGKPDEQENRLDVLELVAVHAGMKPAHLQGHGQHDEPTMSAIESVARAAGLLTRRTADLPAWTHREYAGDPGYYAWSVRPEARPRVEVLWASRDASISAQIDEVLAAGVGVGTVLGYPSCCEIADSEQGLSLYEAMERAFREQFGAQTTEDLIRLAIEDRPVNLGIDIGARFRRSVEAFPFVQFTACDRCLRNHGSPAAKVNNRMRILARRLDPRFARAIAR